MYQRILVGTDGSATASRAVARAVDVAASSGATLTILTAARQAKGEAVVAETASRHAGSGVTIDTKVVEADAVGALIEEAAAGAYDLLVLGNKGMTGVTRFLRPGSVPDKVSHHLPCSVLIVKTT